MDRTGYSQIRYADRRGMPGKETGGCQPNSVAADALDAYISHTIRTRFLSELRETFKARLEGGMSQKIAPTSDVPALKGELRQIQRQIETATERFLTLDDESLAAVAKRKLDDMSPKAEALKKQIPKVERQKSQSLQEQLGRVLAELDRLAEMLLDEDTRTRQQVYNLLIDSLTLWFRADGSGAGGRRFTMEKGILKLKDPASGKLAGPIIRDGRGGPRCIFLNQFGAQQLLWNVFSYSLTFDRDTFLATAGT